jgi:hypothetical protein
MNRYDSSEIFVCECGDVAHHIIFQVWDWGKNNIERLELPAECNIELSIHIPLNPEWKWHKRIWLALKYVFGYRCKFGHYDSMMVRRSDIPRIKSILDRYEEKIQEYEEKLSCPNVL